MIFDGMLKERGVPALDFSSKEEYLDKKSKIKEIIQANEYGFIPSAPEHLSAEVKEEDTRYAGGKATLRNIEIKLLNGEESFSFPIKAHIPNKSGKIPAFIYISLKKEAPNKFQPSEEIADNGFALFSFYYEDISGDNASFKGRLASFLEINRRFSGAPGKLALWAYAAMRVMDYVRTLDFIDKDAVAVIGHSRLGKAALLAAAFDERFKYAISSCSGCCGAAISRGKGGETVLDITNRFPFWFAPKYSRLAADFEDTDFDQNFLLSIIPPRRLIIGSAENDANSDPESEFLGAYSASRIYGLYGTAGLIHENEIPKAPALLDKGSVCYYLRKGESYLTRQDWQVYMNYIKENREKKNDL